MLFVVVTKGMVLLMISMDFILITNDEVIFIMNLKIAVIK